MSTPPGTTAVIINFRTPTLTQRALDTLRSIYNDLHVLLIDNGSRDGSLEELSQLARVHPETTTFLANRRNIHHGPAMDQALNTLESEYVLFLDSDCVVLRGGFLEEMVELCSREAARYAVGKMTWMNERGFDVPEHAGGHPYIRPTCMVIKRELYLTLPPFERHGAPCLKNMLAARQKRLGLIDFPIEDYVLHEGRGTADRHGYRLGLKGKVNHILNRFGL
jgi:glycosyltransferase involved in cell wall biosynthesis